MCAPVVLLSVDPNLGHVDYASFSDQTLMEMLYEGFDERAKKRYQDKSGNYLDVCEWESVACDDDERVVAIIEEDDVSGSLELRYIPPKVQEVHISQKNLVGSIELGDLPRNMENLYLCENEFCGSANLTQLPDEMLKLSLNINKLTGSLDLTNLPHRIQEIRLQVNQFTGSIDLAHLPQKLVLLSLYDNKLTGDFIAKNISPSLRNMYASGNQFNAVAVVESPTSAHFVLVNSGVKSLVDENGVKRVFGVSL